MRFFKLVAAVAAGLLSSTVLAVTLTPVAAGTAYHSELTYRSHDSTGQLIWITDVVDIATGKDPAATLPLQIWPNSRFEPFGYWEDRAWVGFMIPELTGQEVSTVGLSATNSIAAAGSLYVNAVSSAFPGAGESITGSAAASIYADVGNGNFGSGTVLPFGGATVWMTGDIVSEVMARSGNIFYLGLSTQTIQIPLQLTDITLQISTVTPVPVPAAAWLFGSAVIGMFGAARFRRSARIRAAS
jgi:hypothetical protein